MWDLFVLQKILLLLTASSCLRTYNATVVKYWNKEWNMQTNTFQSDRRYRLAFGLTFVTGFALCTRGIAHTTEYGWLHPSSVSGITLGVAAMSLAGAVLLRRRLGPIASEKSALITLVGIIAAKFILSALYPVLR